MNTARNGGIAPEISAVIVNYNSGDLLPACLRALRAADGVSLEIIVVDNGSTDGSLDRLPGDLTPDRVIRSGRNLGFSRANNLGLREAAGRYYLLVNTDCFVGPDLPAILRRRLEGEPAAAVVGPRLRNADGTLQPSCHNFPAPLVLFLEQSMLWQALRPWNGLRTRLAIAGDHAHPAAVDWLSGACLLIRAEAWRSVGGFDEGFFFYWEEADLCRRLRAAGWRVVFEPAAEAVHLGGGSSQNPALRRQFFRSLYRFYRKHYTPAQLVLARGIVGLMALYKAARSGLAGAYAAGSRAAARRAWADARSWLAVVQQSHG